jgi:hypothetical protein
MRRAMPVLCVGFLVFASVASARTWYVKPDSTGDVPTLSVAVDSASAQGDTVLLANGTFSGAGNREVDCLDKALVIVSESGNPDLCTIDCGCGYGCFERRTGIYFRSPESGAQRLEGVTLMGGCGAVVCEVGSRPEIVNCVFRNNKCVAAEVGPAGAGMYCVDGSHPTVIDCVFEGNSAWVGGGLVCGDCSATFINVSFIQNYAGAGAGAFVGNGATFANCLFKQNIGGGSPMGPREGGGLSCWGTVNLVDCVFRDNRCYMGPGGGLLYRGGSASDCLTLTRCTFTDNCVSYDYGGSLAMVGWHGGSAEVIISGCTLVGSGNCGSSVGGGALHIETDGSVILENTIIAFSDSGSAINCAGPGVPVLSCCDIYGNAGGDWVHPIEDQLGVNGNISADPLFCDTLGGDYRLETCSPCLPGNHPHGYDCGVPIGAHCSGCACRGATTATTWGAIKSMYR